MAPTKSYLDKAEHAEKLLSLNENLSEEEISEATGVSVTAARRIKKAFARGVNLAAEKDVASEPLENVLPVDFQEAPQPIPDEPVNEPVVKKGVKLLRGMLGMPEEAEKKAATPQPVQAKLNKQQQTFVTNFSPIAAYGFILIAAWCWSKVGPEYTILQPSEDVAQKITEPLVRIYARHSTFVQSMSPDQIDAGQCIFALVAYVHTSWSMYQKMKAEKEEAETNDLRYRDYEAGYDGDIAQGQNGYNGARDRYAHVQQNAPISATDGTNGRNGQSQHSNLTAKQERELAALSRLSELDYQTRLRRSGRYR